MYVGRFVVVGPGLAAYRVSSRSFPDRAIRERDEGAGSGGRTDAGDDGPALAVVPEDDYDNPYVSYDCLRRAGDRWIVGNGSHVAHVAEKVALGYPPRDALADVLLATDYERDDYDTPRIAGVVDAEPGRNPEPDAATVGIVTRDDLVVEAVRGPSLVATYEIQRPEPVQFDVEGAAEAAEAVYEMRYEHPVAACAAVDGDVAIHNGPERTDDDGD